MAIKSVQFQFNLLPKATKEEIKEIKQRDESTIYGFVLLFFGVFVFLALNLVQIGLIRPRIRQLDRSIATLEKTETSYNSIKATNGELVRKAQLLQTPLSLDIKIDDFLDISDRTFRQFGRIISYDREPKTGDFLVTIQSDSLNNLINLMGDLYFSTEISSIKVLSLGLDRDGKFSLVLQFKINNSTTNNGVATN